MVEVTVAHEEVADLLNRNARILQLSEQYGAAGGVEEDRLVAGKPNGDAGWARSTFKGSPVPRQITRPTAHLWSCSVGCPYVPTAVLSGMGPRGAPLPRGVRGWVKMGAFEPKAINHDAKLISKER